MKNNNCFKFFNNSPNRQCDNDCTTRCISYCLKMDYKAVLKKQKSIARNTGLDYRLSTIWDLLLIRNGWISIDLSKRLRRHVIAKKLQSMKHPIATLSSGHVCPVHRGYVIDKRESQNEYVSSIVCKEKDMLKVYSLLTSA